MSSETELGSDVIVRRVTPVKRYCRATPVFVGMITSDQVILHVRSENLSHRWTSTFPGRMDVSTTPTIFLSGSCRASKRSDSGSDDSPCGNQILTEFEHSDHLGTHTVKGSNQAGFERWSPCACTRTAGSNQLGVRTFRSCGEPELILLGTAGRRLTPERFTWSASVRHPGDSPARSLLDSYAVGVTCACTRC